MRNFLFIFLIVISLFLSACKDDFSPSGSLLQNYAVYCVLDNRLTNQFVLIQKLYMNSNSIEKMKNVKVILSESAGQSFTLKDTILKNFENYNSYFLPNYSLKRDISYRLTVGNDQYPVQWSDTYVTPLPTSANYYVIELKSVGKDNTNWRYTYYSPKPKKNPCIIKLFVEYKISNYEKTSNIEIPISFLQNIKREPEDTKKVFEFPDGSYTPVYPAFITLKKWDSFFRVSETNISASYNDENILFALMKQTNFDPHTVTIKKAYILYCIVDESLYDNFLTVGPESFSVRLDEPYVYTNFKTINGMGIGYFGAVTADTCKFKLDPDIFERYGYTNGQN